MDVKPGIKSSEFLFKIGLVAILMLLLIFKVIDGEIFTMGATVLAGLYGLDRSIVKANASKNIDSFIEALTKEELVEGSVVGLAKGDVSSDSTMP